MIAKAKTRNEKAGEFIVTRSVSEGSTYSLANASGYDATRQTGPLNRKAKNRSGATLVEMLASLSIVGTVLVVLTGLLTMVLRAEGDGRRQLIESVSLARLARKFRDDVHAAVTVSMPADDHEDLLLELTQVGGHRVRYTGNDTSLVREALADGAIASREVFRLPADRASVELEDGGQRVSLWVPYSKIETESPRQLRIDARRRVRPVRRGAAGGSESP